MSKESPKILIIEFSNGDRFEVEGDFVAHARAEYYARKDCKRNAQLKYEEVFKAEFEYARGDDGELLDWINNNMNWIDIAHVARLAPSRVKTFNYHEEFSDAEIKVVSNPCAW